MYTLVYEKPVKVTRYPVLNTANKFTKFDSLPTQKLY